MLPSITSIALMSSSSITSNYGIDRSCGFRVIKRSRIIAITASEIARCIKSAMILRKYAILRRTRRHKVMLAKVYGMIATLFPSRAILHFAWCTCGRCSRDTPRGVGRAPEKPRVWNLWITIALIDAYTKPASKSSDASPLRIIPANRNAFIALSQLLRRVGGLCKTAASRMHAIEVKWVKMLHDYVRKMAKYPNKVLTKASNERLLFSSRTIAFLIG